MNLPDGTRKDIETELLFRMQDGEFVETDTYHPDEGLLDSKIVVCSVGRVKPLSDGSFAAQIGITYYAGQCLPDRPTWLSGESLYEGKLFPRYRPDKVWTTKDKEAAIKWVKERIKERQPKKVRRSKKNG